MLWAALTMADDASRVMPRIELYEGSQKVADIGLPEKKFSTGSIGYWATQKLDINGKRYQCQFQMVEIGTKQKKE
jgi:hypothetical protein